MRRKRAADPEKYREINRKDYARNRQRRIEDVKRGNRALRQSALMAYGACCACCGEMTVEFLEIDHINGDGARHRREARLGNSASFYRWLRDHGYPAGFRVLCSNCNMARGRYGYCPHEKVHENAS
jgi:hypothetical protein